MIEKSFNIENPASIIFDPIPSYGGDWRFSLEDLKMNALVENNVNLFQEWFKKVYQQPLIEIFKFDILNIFDFAASVAMISRPNKNNIGRCLQFSKIDFIRGLTFYLDKNIDRYKLSDEENNKRKYGLFLNIKKDNEGLNMAYADALSEKARRLKDVMINVFNSEYYEAAVQDYENRLSDYIIYDPAYRNISFEDYIALKYEEVCLMQMGMLRLNDFLERSIDYNEMYKQFDPDKFFLLFAKIIYEFNLKIEKEAGTLDNSYGYLFQYRDAVGRTVKTDKKYNPTVTCYKVKDKKVKKHRYSRWQFKEEFEELIERHPEAKAFVLPELEYGGNEKYKDIGLMEKIVKLYSEEAKVNWEFLPKGMGIKRSSSSNSSDEARVTIKKDADILRREVDMRISILENSGYIGTPVKGLNTFNGYYGFIYPNGKVILEKFWENEEELIPATKAATYVMTIDNFIEMSKISRINLVEYIKTLPEIGVKRIFHTSINNWQRNLYNEITGTYRLEDAIDFINSLKSSEARNEN